MRNGAWQPPRLIQITGGSIGYQIGVQATDLVLVFRTPQSVANLLRGTLKVGVDASAAAGPVGRQTSAGTDLQLQAEILSYSRARGAFVGVSIDGSVISLDPTCRSDVLPAAGRGPGFDGATAANAHRVLGGRCRAADGPGQVALRRAAGLPPGSGGGDAEAARQQLDQSSRQLFANLDDELANATWPCRRKFTRRTRCRIRRRCSRRPRATRKCRAARNTRPCKPGPNFRKRCDSLRAIERSANRVEHDAQLPPPPR